MNTEKTCFTCNKEYCRYANKTPDGKYQYNYKLLFECRNHGHFFWKEKITTEVQKGEVEGILIHGISMPKEGELLSIDIHPDGRVCINLDLECKQIATATSVLP